MNKNESSVMNQIERCLEIFRRDGIIELLRRSMDFLFWQILLSELHAVKIYTIKNNILNQLKYDAPPNPYGKITISARDVKYNISRKTSPIRVPHCNGFAQTKGGDWPQNSNIKNLDSYYLKKSFEQRFVFGEKWEETELYKRLLKNKNREETLKILKNKDNLYDSISKNGYQSECDEVEDDRYKDKFDPFVVIDEEGEIYLWDGRHRLIIAQILDLSIPVQVVCRHKSWQEKRDDIYINGFCEDYDTELYHHPDLQDIFNDSV